MPMVKIGWQVNSLGNRVMWAIVGKPNEQCDGIPRRTMLQIGALAGAGLTLPDLLRSRREVGARESVKPRQALLVFLPGGPSHYESFDPKPDAPLEIRGPRPAHLFPR